jgi:hypothetical protein
MEPVFSADFFRPYINTPFMIRADGVPMLELILLEIKEQNNAVLDEFTLIFSGPTDRIAYDNTYRLEHEVLGQFDMFLGPFFTPLKNDAVYYQAVFTHFKKGLPV